MTRHPRRSFHWTPARVVLSLALACGAGCAEDAKTEPDASAGAPHAGAGAGGSDDADGGSAGSDGGSELCTSCGSCAEHLPVTSFTHVTGPIDYPDPPPVGGNHDPCWASWGVHRTEVPARNWVHNLEHGGIVFLYDCPDGCDDDLAAFTQIARANSRTLLTPYPGLRTRFALTAWGHRLLSDCVDARAFQAFYDAYFDHGLESVGSGPPASCPQ